MRARLAAAAAGLAALLALAWLAQGRPDPDTLPLRIAAPTLAAGGVTTLRWPDGRDVELVPVPAGAGPLDFDVHEAGGVTPFARLLLTPAADALLYVTAARDADFAPHLLPARLALLDGAGTSPRSALLLPPRQAEAAASTLGKLELETAAALLAAGQALGAWDRLATGRFPLDANGRPFLAPFTARTPGNWERLRGGSLASFLPRETASALAAVPGLREASTTRLAAHASRLGDLADAVVEAAAKLDGALAAAELEALRKLLVTHGERLAAYLDSSWAEQVVTRLPSGALHVVLDLHTLVALRLEGLAARLPDRLALAEKAALARLRLRALPDGGSVRARVQRDGLAFPLARRVEPLPLGPLRFGSTRLEFALEGLEPGDALGAQLLDALGPHIVRAASGEPLADDHVRRLAAIDDPRFGQPAEETPEQFAAQLDRRLRAGGELRWKASPASLAFGAGRYELTEDLVLPVGATLRLEPGVELEVRPGRSILVRGRLVVAGTRARPVHIRGTDADRPWGVLAVQGHDGRPGSGQGGSKRGGSPRGITSEIRYLELEGGSEDLLRGASYSGQLSVHHQHLSLDHVALRRSHADDSLNVRYGSVAIRDSRFLDSAADAVDLDWVEGSIERSLFAGMGPEGDGLDLSGSDVSIDDSVFSQAGDKCLSVGERSSARLRGSLLRSCGIGLASKDLSSTSVRESLFLANAVDLAAYRKKAVFGGAQIRAHDLVLVDGVESSAHDATSTIEVSDALWIGGGPGEIEPLRSRTVPADSELRAALDVDSLARASGFSVDDYRALRRSLP